MSTCSVVKNFHIQMCSLFSLMVCIVTLQQSDSDLLLMESWALEILQLFLNTVNRRCHFPCVNKLICKYFNNLNLQIQSFIHRKYLILL